MKIVLIGFMGAGKSSVAKKLGEKLNLKVVEMDDLIMKKTGKSIREIFHDEGEAKFRELEIETANMLRNSDNVIISTGGGVVINKVNIDNLKENGKIIFLRTSFLEIKKRLKNINDRPLFKNKQSAEKLFVFRQNLYKEYADLIVDTDNRTIEEIVNNLQARLSI